MKMDLTVVILTKNEERHLGRCINSVKEISSRVIIVDSFSTDKTLDIALSYSNLVSVYQHPFKNHADQFQWGLDNCDIDTQWTMRLDADEYLEPDLIAELPEALLKLHNSSINGLIVRRKYFYKGQWIRFGGVYPLNLLRIWKTGTAHVEARWMDEHIVLDFGESASLKGHIVDYNYNDISWWSRKHVDYATREAIELLNLEYNFFYQDDAMHHDDNKQAKLKRLIKEKIYWHLPPSLRSTLYFFYRYFIRLGILDGRRGWEFHFLQGWWYRTLVDVRYVELKDLISKARNVNEKIKLLADYTGFDFD